MSSDAPGASGPFGPFGLTAIGLSLVFLTAGVAWPQMAETALRALFVSLACAFVALRAWEAALPAQSIHDTYSPFEGDALPRPGRALPEVMQTLSTGLAAADDDRRARESALPPGVRRTIGEEARRRLAEHHGLRPDEPAHHARIRSLVSEPTRLLLDDRDPGPFGGGATIPLGRLDAILDDLERL